VHALLAPYRGTLLAPYDAVLTLDGAADTSLGQLETVLGRFDDAARSFEAGLEIEERMGYTALAARTRLWWARLLLSRARPRDRETARRLWREAAATAERHGLGLLLQDLAAFPGKEVRWAR
jgi:hypothetical protein